MKAVIKWLDEHIESSILIALSILTVVVVFVQVFMRYVMGSSFVWSEELARYAFIWMIYIGVSYGVKKQAHISIDSANLLFGRTGKFILALVANLAFFVFAIFITYFTFELVMKVNRLSPAMGIPMKWVYAAPMVGMFLTTIRIIQRIVIDVKNFLEGEEA